MQKFILTTYFILITFLAFTQTQGSLDASFGTNGIVKSSLSSLSDRSTAIIEQKDGKILVYGHSIDLATFTAVPSTQLVRYNTNGTLDSTFGILGKVNTKSDTAGYYGFAIALQLDGKIVVAGLQNNNLCVMRYNSNGTLDLSFDSDGIAVLKIQGNVSEAHTLAIQPDGKILVAGSIALFNAPSSYAFLVRFNTNGSLDNTFNSIGYVKNILSSNSIDGAYDMVIQSDGKILICGYSVVTETTGYNYTSFVYRYNTNGTIDNTFGVNGVAKQSNSRATSIKLMSNGKMVVGGLIYDNVSFNPISSNGIYRYNVNGTLDNTFGTNGVVKSNSGKGAYDMALQRDSKIVLLSTDIATVGQINRDIVISRYTVNGILDTTFAIKGVATTKNAIGISDPRITLQADGKILVCGEVKENNKSNFTVLRYNNNIGTSVKSIETTAKVSVYPNPFQSDVKIKLYDLDVEKLQLRISDAFGQIVVVKNYEKLYKEHDISINLEQLPSGLYFITLNSDKIFQSQSLLKL
ncbi:MAG: T9SS type A sorting domain-containing protein [Saprospiraceae bacterium]|nr:T9SS type A sorting domain-containing protein [Saprospiraceae bacterium]